MRLTVVAPPGADCVTPERLRGLVHDRVGSVVLSDAWFADRHVDVRIVVYGRGFSAAIRAVDEEGRTLGERSVSTDEPRCGALERPLVLVISTLIGMDEDSARSAVERRPAPVAPRPTEKNHAARPAPATNPPSPSEPFRLALAVGGGAESGLLPGLAPFGTLRLLARRSFYELRLGVGVAPWAARDLGEAAHATFRSLFGNLDVCAVTSAGAAGDFAFCGGLRAGALRAETTGLYENVTSTRPFAEVTLGANLTWPLTVRQALILEVGGAVPVVPQRYVFVDSDAAEHPIHTVELGLFGEIGWVLRFAS